MVRIVKSQHEVDDYEFSSRNGMCITYTIHMDMYAFALVILVAVKVEGKKAANAVRSKHSDAEQRRRSKINERQVFFFPFLLINK